MRTHRHAWTGSIIDVGDPQQCRPEQPPVCFVRPNIVLFGESIAPAWWEAHSIVEQMEECDVMLVVGTTCTVAPAATLPVTAMNNGCRVVEVNPHPCLRADDDTVLHLVGPAGVILPAVAKRMQKLIDRGVCNTALSTRPCRTNRSLLTHLMASRQVAAVFDSPYDSIM